MHIALGSFLDSPPLSKLACKSTPLDADVPALPPSWNSDKTNCVAGSPIAWALSIPTLSPINGKPSLSYFKP